MQSQPEVFAALRPMRDAFEIKQRFVWRIRQYQYISPHQQGEQFEKKIK